MTNMYNQEKCPEINTVAASVTLFKLSGKKEPYSTITLQIIRAYQNTFVIFNINNLRHATETHSFTENSYVIHELLHLLMCVSCVKMKNTFIKVP